MSILALLVEHLEDTARYLPLYCNQPETEETEGVVKIISWLFLAGRIHEASPRMETAHVAISINSENFRFINSGDSTK
jgi:hypothetical protein